MFFITIKCLLDHLTNQLLVGRSIGCSYIASNDYFTLTAIPCTDVLPIIKIILYVLFMFYIVYYY